MAGVSRGLRDQLATPLQLVGGFVKMCLMTAKALGRWPFQWREFIVQRWFLARVAFLPTIAVAVPLTVLIIFTLNILLAEFGAADVSGAGAALGAVTQLGPLVTVLVVAGAGSTAICADLGARTIREEIDAMEVMGIDPIHRLVVLRVVASTMVATLSTARSSPSACASEPGADMPPCNTPPPSRNRQAVGRFAGEQQHDAHVDHRPDCGDHRA